MAGRYLESRSTFSVASSLSDDDGMWWCLPWTVTSMEISPLMECLGGSIASDLMHKTKRDSLVSFGAYHDPRHMPRVRAVWVATDSPVGDPTACPPAKSAASSSA